MTSYAIRTIEPGNFPARLAEITDPPKKLFIRGTYPSQSLKFLCVVGSRKYSSYGKQVVEKLIAGLSGYPVVIISGLALGIDSIAHKEALKMDLTTIAIPGSGLNSNVLYPASHLGLARKILKKEGALLSEFEPDFRATPWSFPQRNRIMAGLSDAVLVVEAQQKSGTLITARLAMEYNRDVLTVPGSIFSKNSEGPHFLIKNGATPITTTNDLIRALGLKIKKQNSTSKEALVKITKDEQLILDALAEPLSKEELIKNTALTISALNVALSTLELKGLVNESLGKFRIR